MSKLISFLVIGPEYMQRLLSGMGFRGQYYVQETLPSDRHDNSFGLRPSNPGASAKNYMNQLGDFDVVVLVASQFSEHEVASVRSRCNGKLVVYDDRLKSQGLRQQIDGKLAEILSQPPAETA